MPCLYCAVPCLRKTTTQAPRESVTSAAEGERKSDFQAGMPVVCSGSFCEGVEEDEAGVEEALEEGDAGGTGSTETSSSQIGIVTE